MDISERENASCDQLFVLMKEYPDLPIIPVVEGDIVADDCYTWWIGHWGRSEKTAVYIGREMIHFIDDDEEDVLADMIGCKYYETPDGRDITDISDEEWNELYASIPWEECIVVYITT